MANVVARRRQEQQKARALKKMQMSVPGYESTYAKRKAARNRGEPMATREKMPWWHVEFSDIFNRMKPEERAPQGALA